MMNLPDSFKPYCKRSVSQQETINKRLVECLTTVPLDQVITTIAPEELVRDLWEEHSFYKDYRNFELEFLPTSMDGSHFKVVRKV